ncbi:MAG TPA: hypothetical protein VGE98_03080, partial [Thermoanaerobaculia bacterium]
MRRLLTIAFLLSLVGPATLPAKGNRHIEFFESGLRALRTSSWDAAAFWFARAAQEQSRDGGPPARLSGRNYVPFLPYYYLGYALYKDGKYKEAFTVWDQTEARWQNELARSKGLDHYRREIRRHRAHFASAVLPQTTRRIERYLAAIRSSLDSLCEPGPPPPPAVAEKIAAARDRLPAWQGELQGLGSAQDLNAAEDLIQQLASTLDYLAGISTCRPAAARGDSWCQEMGFGPAEATPSSPPPPGARGSRFGARPTVAFARLATTPPVAPAPTYSWQGRSLTPAEVSWTRGLYAHKVALLVAPTYPKGVFKVIDENHKKVDAYAAALTAQGFEVTTRHEPMGAVAMTKIISDFFTQHLFTRSSKPDLILFHFVGHAIHRDDGGRPFAFLATSETPGAKAPIEEIARTSLAQGFFNQWYGLEAKHLLFTFETCFSGSFVGNTWCTFNPRPFEVGIDKPVSYVLTASDRDELASAELPLTEALTRAFLGCTVHGDEELTSGFLLLRHIQGVVLAHQLNPQILKSLRGDGVQSGDLALILRNRCPGAPDPIATLGRPAALPPWPPAAARA